jgi:hypothetical protein
MMVRVAWRSLVARPVRAAVLAAGFGFGIAVMVELLGVGHVILEQSRAPALLGGGDLMIGGLFGSVPSARFVMWSVLGGPDLSPRISAVSPTRQSRVFLMTPAGSIPVNVTGGIPSLEKSIGDPEVSGTASWADAPGDERWSHPDPGDVLRALDRFHAIPDIEARASSWSEWLYFNGRSRDGRVRVYLTFFVGPPADAPGKRRASVRLQLERDGQSRNYSAEDDVDEASILSTAPDLDIAGNHVRLEGLRYTMTLALQQIGAPSASGGSPPGADRRNGLARSTSITGEIVLDAAPRRALPPTAIRGAGGWVSGYVVPALAGSMSGALRVDGEPLEFHDAVGYHDHNWGFWEGVSWQWGQVAHDQISVVYGRVFPPADVADPTRIPGFLAVLGPDGPLGFSTDVVIDDARPGQVEVRATGKAVELRLSLTVDETVRTGLAMTRVPGARPLSFLQLGGVFHVTGQVAGRAIDFSARGSAETFKPR